MEHIKKSIPSRARLTQAAQTGSSRSEEKSHDSDDRTKKIVAGVFEALISIYPAWRHATYGDAEDWAKNYKRQLFTALSERRITTLEQINKGLATARQEGGAFLPNPGNFARWCKTCYAPYHRDFDDTAVLEHMRSSKEKAKQEIEKLKQVNAAGIAQNKADRERQRKSKINQVTRKREG